MISGNDYKRSRYTKAVREQIASKPEGAVASEIGSKLKISRNAVISAINYCNDIAEDDLGKLYIVRW